MGDSYSYVGAVVGATYPEQGRILRKIMPKAYILVPGYGAQGGKGADLVHFFDEDGLGAIVNSSRGIIAASQVCTVRRGELRGCVKGGSPGYEGRHRTGTGKSIETRAGSGPLYGQAFWTAGPVKEFTARWNNIRESL